MDEVVENKRDFFEVKYKTNTGLDYTFTFNNPKNTMSEMKKFCSCFGGISISNLNNTEINYQLLIRNNFLIIKYQDSIIDYDSIPYDECLSILLDLFARVFAVSKQNAGLVDYQKKKNNI